MKQHSTTHTTNLLHQRILVCGKGGSGKSTVVTILARELCNKGQDILVIDGDASNPGGLSRLLFGLQHGPRPLIDFFGGRTNVDCPVDNPAGLTRINDSVPITTNRLKIAEIPSDYYYRSGGLLLFQVGKIETACEGCDGPMSKVSRDFILAGNWITLVDVEAGIEHFGRGLEENVDIVIVVVDPTYESYLIAERVIKLNAEMGIKKTGAILNKIDTPETQSIMEDELSKRKIPVMGVIMKDASLFEAGLKGSVIKSDVMPSVAGKIIESLEKLVHGEPKVPA
jgi:CO dehydrogenase maturation factor